MIQTLATLSLALLLNATTFAADLNLVVILDNSGSMNQRMRAGETRIEAAKRSLLTVLEQAPAYARVGVVLLNPARIGDDWLVPLGPVDLPAVRRAIAAIRAGGPTPLGGAMKRAADALLAQRQSQRYGDYKVLVVSDGEATDQPLVDRYLPEAQARGLLIDVIGVDMGAQHSLAARANTYRNAADPASLEQAISAVVLGESDPGAGDAAESDFEILAPIPGEVAAAALTTLTATPNTPIQGSGPRPVAAAPPAGTPPLGGPAPGPPVAPVPQGDEGGGLSVGAIAIAAIVFFFLLNLIGKAKGR